jgi:ketosteroid isomerase-like protein
MGDDLAGTLTRYLRHRREADEGRRPWTDMTAFFTDDAVFVDPLWGRLEGIEEIRRFLADSMTGIEDWRFPIDAAYVSGDEVVLKYRQVLPARRPDGRPFEQSGYSTLLYAGDGKFSYEEDVINMIHVFEDIRASGWTPPPRMHAPPRHPNRDFSRPI